MLMRMPVTVVLVMFVGMIRFVRMCVQCLLRPELFARQLFFTSGNHIYLSGADAAAVYAGNLQPRIHLQGFNGADEQLSGHAGINQRAKKHVPTDA